ncbi:MAG: putative capsular polysaccharide synthesis family protein [Bacteroidota bacterium]
MNPISAIKSYLRPIRYQALKGKTILIYNAGKVGSRTLYFQLHNTSPFDNVYHTHFLSKEWLERLKGTKYFDENWERANMVFNHLEKKPAEKRYIITLVREPISREFSNYFQHPDDYVNGDIHSYSISEVVKRFYEILNFEYYFNWFDTELRTYTGFDVFDCPFDKETGYTIYDHDELTKVLVIKLEKLNDCYQEAIQKFLGIKLKFLVNANEANQKDISSLYKEVKHKIRFTGTRLDEIYSHRFVTHFYSPAEIEKFKAKYCQD